jgi:hypothetical protein
MLVKILGFGSNWWARFGRQPDDPWRFTRHAAYHNSSGICCGRKIRRHWLVPGLIRFNGVGGFDPHFPNRSIGKTFCSPGPTLTDEGNRLLLGERANRNEAPDYFLTVVSSERHGVVDFKNTHSISANVLLLAVSELHVRQEAILLMQTGSWLLSSVGFWQLAITPRSANGVSLRPAESFDSVFI